MLFYLFFVLSVFSHIFLAASQNSTQPIKAPIYLNLDKAMSQCGDSAGALDKILKTSDAIALKMGSHFVYYWQPKEGSHFVDITQNVIDNLRKK